MGHKRILVTGGRDFDDYETVQEVLDEVSDGVERVTLGDAIGSLPDKAQNYISFPEKRLRFYRLLPRWAILARST